MAIRKWTPTTLLRATRDKLNDGGKHWTKGSPSRPIYGDTGFKRTGVAYCVLGGFTAVLDGNPRDNNIPKEQHPAVIALANAIREERGQQPCASIDAARSTIIGFNDHTRTTWKDVDKILRRAAARPKSYIEQSSENLQRRIGWIK
jgi:hypothetical protein